jgi:FAD:protein FMN transferase
VTSSSRDRGPVVVGAEAMRTRFEIVLADDRDPAWLLAAGEEALEEIARVEGDLSPFRRDSLMVEVNAEAAEHPVLVDAATFEFFARAGALCAAVDGAFDPTVGPLTALYRRGDPFGDDEIAAARALVGFARRVRLDAAAGTVAFTSPGVRLDPGAIGKGWALDRAAAVLRELGVTRALLHGGTSSVHAIGAPPGAEAWMVAIADPVDPARVLARASLRDAALGVSAPHGRLFQRAGRLAGHVLDPRSGDPVDHTALAAVVTSSATDADAVSTALLVLGAAGVDRLAERFPDASLLVATPGAEGLRVDLVGGAFGE